MSKFSEGAFLSACGGTGPLKVLLENRETKTKADFVFDQPNILVGQSAAANIRLWHPSINDQYLYLQVLDGYLFGLPLTGPGTVQWGGQAKPHGWISLGDAIDFGPFVLKILEGICPATPESTTSANPLLTSPNCVPPICFEYLAQPSWAFRGSINRQLTLVGSAASCKFRINHGGVSSLHCSLVRTRNGIWAVDLGGQNGIRVNGVAGPVACLQEGDRFEIGELEFHIHYESPAPQNVSLALAEPKPPSLPIAQRQVKLDPVIAPSQSLNESPPIDRETIERIMGPVLDRFTAFQEQTFAQFQDLLNNVMQMFGTMFREQQEFVREEMRRFDRLGAELAGLQDALKSAPLPPFAIPVDANGSPTSSGPPLPTKPLIPPPEPRSHPDDPVADTQMHLWLQARISELHDQRNTLWSRLLSLLRGESKSK